MSLQQSNNQVTSSSSEVLDFRDWIQDSLEHESNDMTFISSSVLNNRLEQAHRLRHILQAIDPAGRVDLDTVRRNYKAVLAILILCGQTGYLEQFTKHPNLGDDKLPFYTKPDHFPSDVLWPQFSEHQWKFRPHVFYGHAHTELHPSVIVPFLRKDHIKRGGTADVYRVTIHPDYDYLRSETAASAPRFQHANNYTDGRPTVPTQYPKYYALKTFHQTGPRAKVLYEAEKAAFLHFRSAGAETNIHNIIAFHGGFVQNENYNILLEFAEHGTLEEFFQARYHLPHGQALIPLWESMSGLLAAVFTIHDVPPSKELAETHQKHIFHG